MKIDTVLQERKQEIVAAWLDEAPHLVEASLLGQAFRSGAGAVLEALALGNPEGAANALEWVMRIRALQAEEPAVAARFLHDLKAVVRRLSEPISEEELALFESRVDRLAAAAAEMFARNRRQISKLARRTAWI